MSEALVFYTNPMSRGRMVRWMLEETGTTYRTEMLEYGKTMKSAEYLAINPLGKVPAIRHGSAVVTETAAICAYLADAFPAADVYCGSQVGFGLQFGSFEKRPAFVEYWKRISARDGYRRAREIDDAVVAGT